MNTNEILVRMVLQSWEAQVSGFNKLLDELTDEQLSKEVAPGKNTGTYLLGHMVAVHDRLNDLLGLGSRTHPELDEPFISNPDKSGLKMPPLLVLREYLKEVNDKLSKYLKEMAPEDFFKRHNSMTEEDLIKEPTRNKLSVLISRTTHAAYHLGQLKLLSK